MKRARMLMLRGLPVLAALWICGCDTVPEGQLPTAPVEVTVIHNKQPVEEAIVTFVGNEGTPPAYGRTDANGKAMLTTYSAGDGATLGTHMVSIVKQELNGVEEELNGVEEEASQDSPDYMPSPGASPLPKVKDLLPQKFALPATSGLQVEVIKGKNEVTLDLDK